MTDEKLIEEARKSLRRALDRKAWREDGWEVPAIDVQTALDLLGSAHNAPTEHRYVGWVEAQEAALQRVKDARENIRAREAEENRRMFSDFASRADRIERGETA